MRILVEPSSGHCLNAGDVAMLQVAYCRFRTLWPGASIHILTSAPALLEQYCPGAIPIDAQARSAFFESGSIATRLQRLLPKTISGRFGEFEYHCRQRVPLLTRTILKLYKPQQDEALVEYLEALRQSNLVVATGAGQITDPFAGTAAMVLNTLQLAVRWKIPAILLGQGIGPITDAALTARCRSVLPRMNLITLREGRCGLPILRAAGVRPHRVIVTGDEACEAGFERRPKELGRAIGINVRMASYAGVERTYTAVLRRAIHHTARELGAPLAAIPISHHSRESDMEGIRCILQEYSNVLPFNTGLPVASAIEQAGRCRIVVTGSYHGAVFALSQGVTVVGLTNSDYYTAKFEGLIEQFGVGCRYIRMKDPEFPPRLEEAIREGWEAAPGNRSQLLEATARQVQLGREAYRRVHEEVQSTICASAQ